jgi:hypothetical protein
VPAVAFAMIWQLSSSVALVQRSHCSPWSVPDGPDQLPPVAVSVALTIGVPLIAGAELTVGPAATADAGAANTPSSPAAMKLMMRLDKSPPPCGPVREPTS